MIIGIDKYSVVKRMVDVSKLIDNKDLQGIPMRDLTVNKEVKDTQDTGLIESRKTDPLIKGGNKIHIQDITSTKL